MSLEPFHADARVCLVVVSLGTPQRLRDCLDSIAKHQSRHGFSVVCVVNPGVDEETSHGFPLPEGIEVLHPPINLGWPGGLHYARSRTNAEYLVWVQEDMTVADGWLDALVDAADANPAIAAFGSLSVDDAGMPTGRSAGLARPADDVSRWNETDSTSERVPTQLQETEWVTSKGMLTRVAQFDEIGGPDPRLFPLNHVDKDYTTHLRAHGHRIALVPNARLMHLQSQSAPSMFRRFVSEYRDPAFNARWGAAVESLAAGGETVDHDCQPWFKGVDEAEGRDAAISAAVAREATTMLIAFAKWADRFTAVAVQHQVDVDNHAASLERHTAMLAMKEAQEQASAAEDIRRETASAYEATLSWRITRPLRSLRSLVRRG